jgi:hypothetical protein
MLRENLLKMTSNKLTFKDIVKDITDHSVCSWGLMDKKYHFFTHCTNLNAYHNDPSRPVVYIDAHYDTVIRERDFESMPVIVDNYSHTIMATALDNRVSCAVLYTLIQCEIFQDNNIIFFCIFSDGEETGMIGIETWLSDRTKHNQEYFIVLDVTHPEMSKPECANIGRGVYHFDGDIIETLFDSKRDLPENLFQQNSCREPYPSNLMHTHAGRIYRHELPVGRIAIPVAYMHDVHSMGSLGDIEAMYLKVRAIVQHININFFSLAEKMLQKSLQNPRPKLKPKSKPKKWEENPMIAQLNFLCPYFLNNKF